MSERSGGGGFGSFLLGMAVGAVAGFLFAPEAGGATRAKLGKRLRGLRDLAEDRVGDLLARAGRENEEEDEEEPEEPAALPSAREELERRLGEARRRRRSKSGVRGETARSADVEDEEPVA